ncbi:MAG: TetR family transcriptional regulator C-terminal domain-containing protein [Gemmatimonadota bacterium]|nr:TetR family transcriptional regulator C-terminal domain-containing protein [Gemmatimonadota bacterium]
MPRPKSFDPDEKLGEAMTVFQRNGFGNTSIPLLERELGINRFSLYDTYGPKRKLFIKALERFRDIASGDLEQLESGTGGRADLRRFFREFRRRFVEEQSEGCLLNNTGVELGSHDRRISRLIEDYFVRLERAILAALLRARKLGEIDASSSDLRDRAAGARSGLQGVLVTRRLSNEPGPADRTLSAVEACCLQGIGAS